MEQKQRLYERREFSYQYAVRRIFIRALSFIRRPFHARKEEINRLAFNGEFYEDHAVRKDGKLVLQGHITETCQYYAFYFGVATKENKPNLYRTLFTEFLDEKTREERYSYVAKSNMFIGDVLRMDYLYKSCEVEQAVAECLALFGGMAEKTGTIWEFEGAVASCTHAFAAVCCCWFVAEQKKIKVK